MLWLIGSLSEATCSNAIVCLTTVNFPVQTLDLPQNFEIANRRLTATSLMAYFP